MNDHVDLTNLRIDGKLDSIPAKSRSGVSKWLWKRLLIGAALLALLGFGADYGWHYWEVGRFQESTDDAYVQTDSTIVAPRVSGYLREVFVADNQMVRAHQPLAKIDDRDYAIALKQATANVDGARATIDNIRASIEQQQPTIEQVRSTAVLDQANLTFAQQEHDRYTKLANQGSGSVQNAQQAVSKLDVAKATLERDGAAVLSAEKQIHVLKAQLTKAEAALVHEQAAAEQAQLNLI